MDTVKIGNFLRELRKEKGLTQEQLAEVFNVSGRTVSRWETGSNMPDISILIEIADYYGLDVKEIINGCRNGAGTKDEAPDQGDSPGAGQASEGSSLRQVAEYADREKEKLAVRTRIYTIAGLAGIVAYVFCSATVPSDSMAGRIFMALLLLTVYIALAASLIYTSDKLQTLQRKIGNKIRSNVWLIVLTVIIGIVLFLLLIPIFFMAAQNG